MLCMASSWDMRPSRPQRMRLAGSIMSMRYLSFFVTVSGLPVTI